MRRDDLKRRFGQIGEKWGDRLLTALTALLAFLVFVLVPLHASGVIGFQGYGFALVFVLASCVLGASRSPFAVLAIVAGTSLVFVAIALRAHDRSPLDLYFDAAGFIVVELALAFLVARAVFAPGRVTFHRINGAILLYMTIGLIFMALYGIVGLAFPGAFAGLAIEDKPALLGNLSYFSFTTLTTIGYGDITPVHPIARSLSNLEGVIGQLYPATLLARLVTLELQDRR
ncbi:potassium channel family protein [Methylocapsa palsarum]|uniref:Ion channel n=1 Tax=Methylocapsa palsarum TaxID=1612308 RepID=A0A1I3WGY3_9HYPH|nr:potassium channel family protein [Methylocapsa palsarum]SFK05701.1 Ion channel [Methylocapsa palsarum]